MSANRWAWLSAILLAGCGHYSDFTLPTSGSGDPPPLHLHLAPDPVMSRGEAGDWDSSDVLNPSVALRDRLYWNFYSGYDGKSWSTGVATSPDGIAWQKRGKVLSPEGGGYIAANGSALWRGNEWLYWYQMGEPGAQRIGLARSPDGLHWTRQAKPVLDVGPYMSWDERDVADPYVIEVDGMLYLYYLGQDRAARQRIGLARSKDGVAWEKLRSNPVLDLGTPGSGAMDERGLGEPSVFLWRGAYRMLFTGRDAHEIRRIGAAWSHDGVHWTRQKEAFAGDRAWDAKVICDPTVIVKEGRVRVWFGGGDVASPDQGLHGQIGIATIE